MLCSIGKKSPESLHRATTYRCRYEKIRANSLLEMARLKVEGPYVILYLCMEPATASKHSEMDTMKRQV